MTEREMVGTAVKALDSKKGKDIRVLYTADQTTLADYFIICNGTSNTQVKALADAVEEAMSQQGEEPHHVEGHRGGQWTLLRPAHAGGEERHLPPGKGAGTVPERAGTVFEKMIRSYHLWI